MMRRPRLPIFHREEYVRLRLASGELRVIPRWLWLGLLQKLQLETKT